MVGSSSRFDAAVQRRAQRVLLTVLSAAILGSAAPLAHATNLIWDANGAVPPHGTFNVLGNWNDNTQFPTAGDTAIFSINNTYTVTFTANAASDAITVSAGTVSLVGNGPPRTYNLTTGAADLALNNSNLNIGAAFAPLAVTVGDSLSIGTSGNATTSVSGAGSALNVNGLGSHSIGFSTSSGTLNYTNDSTGTIAGTLNVGVSTTSPNTGNLNVNTGADLDVANLNIGTSAVSTGTGTVTVTGAGSTLDMTGASVLNIGSASANIGILNVNSGGTFSTGTGAVTVNATGDINLGGGGTLNLNGNTTINGGAISTDFASALNLASGRTMTIQNNGQVNLGQTALSGGTTWNINSGGDLIGSFQINTSLSGDNTVIVDGTGSSLQAAGSVSQWGRNGHTADVTIRNGASASVSELRLASDSVTSTTGTLNVQSGASMAVGGGLLVGSNGGPTTTATITVDGAGSTLTMGPGNFVVVGSNSLGTATITVQNSGTFNAARVHVDDVGQININGGTFAASENIFVSGGSITQTAGTFVAQGDVTLQNGGALTLAGSLPVANQTYRVESGATMTVNGTAHIQLAGRIRIAGGTATLNAVTFGDIRDTLDLSSGTLNIPTAPSVSAGFNWSGGTLHVTGAGGLTIGAAGPLGASLALHAAQHLEVDNNLTINSGAELFASGGLSAGSLVNNGDLIVSSTTVNGPVTNNANITAIGNVTFNDLVTGPGGFYGPGTITFTGGMSPGASPAEVSFEGGITLANSNTLFIEIGGTVSGTEFDAIDVAGNTMLGGTIDVDLINSFIPSAGQSFPFLTYSGGFTGNFHQRVAARIAGRTIFRRRLQHGRCLA